MSLVTKIIIALVIIYFAVNYIHDEYPDTYEKLEKSFPIVEKFINLKTTINKLGEGIDIDLNLDFNDSAGDSNA